MRAASTRAETDPGFGDPGFGVYVHWPFCAQKCPYCDFNSHVRHAGWDEARFLAAYKGELSHVAELLRDASLSPPPSRGRVREGGTAEQPSLGFPPPLAPPRQGEGRDARPTVTSIFFGGGTPSLMKPETTAAILDHIATLWTVEQDAEITLEANPGSVEAGRFRGYRTAGVNRVSIGVQSLDDEQLRKLGRIHTVADAKAAVEVARGVFDRFSLDLIYARPGQSPHDWRRELDEALALAGKHMSLYQLTVEPGTRFADLYAVGKLAIPDGEAAHALYEITQERTARAGLPAYEISNHSTAGEESRHNLLYWRYGTYAGVGPGAHGRLVVGGDRLATVCERNPEQWVEAVERDGHGFTETVPLSRAEQADEMLLMGLRLNEGISLERLAAVGGVRPRASVLRALEREGLLKEAGAAEYHGDEIRACVGPGLGAASEWSDLAQKSHDGLPERIRATARGRFVLNAVIAELAAAMEPVDGQATRSP